MRNNQRGFSLIELLIVVAIILIIAAIAIPNLLRSKMAANEASAVASLRTYNTTIVAYQTTYATDPDTSRAQLGPVTSSTAPSSASADLVDSLLGAAAPAKSGYNFSYAPIAGPPVTQYTILATPQSSSAGQRYFMTNQSGVIYQTSDGKVPSIGASDTTPIGQ
jgi:prepilin-type N-terminal cleavage/methylation domain-containing protein